MSKKVKSIETRIVSKGRGVINFDSKEQKWEYFRFDRSDILPNNSGDNLVFAKKSWYFDKEANKHLYKLYVSSQCIKREVFGYDDDNINALPVLSSVDDLINLATSKSGLLRGFMVTNSSGITYNRKGALTVSDFIQTADENGNMSQSTFPLGGKDGARSKTSLYSKETIGDISYDGEIKIDLRTLQFIKLDALLGEQSFNNDNVEMFQEKMKSRFNNYDGKYYLYKHRNSESDLYYAGILLDEQTVKTLVKFFMNQINNFTITRNRAHMTFEHIEYRFRYGVSDTSEWKKLDDSGFDDVEYDIDMCYIETDNYESSEEFRNKKYSSIKSELEVSRLNNLVTINTKKLINDELTPGEYDDIFLKIVEANMELDRLSGKDVKKEDTYKKALEKEIKEGKKKRSDKTDSILDVEI